jgi:hypothetical protein
LDRLRSYSAADDKQEPAASENLHSSLILTYGKDDNKLMALTLGYELLEEWLIPISNLSPDTYKFCSLVPDMPTKSMLKVKS